MRSIENRKSPNVIGEETARYMWECERHHVLNHILTLVCMAVFITIAQTNGIGQFASPWAQAGLSVSMTLGVFFMIRAIHDYQLRHIRYLAIVGTEGFCIYKYNEEEKEVLSEYVQPYNTLSYIEKEERQNVAEDGAYLQTVTRYTFFAPEKKFSLRVKYNRHDVHLDDGYSLPDVKAMMAIEKAYDKSSQGAHVFSFEDQAEVIPSHPQSLLKIHKPVMWADIEE